jgi:hypothetical protein
VCVCVCVCVRACARACVTVLSFETHDAGRSFGEGSRCSSISHGSVDDCCIATSLNQIHPHSDPDSRPRCPRFTPRCPSQIYIALCRLKPPGSTTMQYPVSLPKWFGRRMCESDTPGESKVQHAKKLTLSGEVSVFGRG